MAATAALLMLLAARHASAACTFSESWRGGWFQSGMPALIQINDSYIQSKGECHETEGHDKFLLYDKSDDCYRCMVIHEKHESVLQYKETSGCLPKDSLPNICENISGDAPLYSMFRKVPPPAPVPCPFRQPPFTFTYSRGTGDCANPPSKAESCTDDSRLVLRYQACPDVPGTESNVEELVCLATWKEGSTRYLVGTIAQMRRHSIVSDEDVYRCFVYKGSHWNGRMSYSIAQSGDATCSALSSPTDGSRTITLTASDDHHRRCHFPSWITEHHKWLSLDHSHQYHFTQRNATLRVSHENGSVHEMRLVCHSILEQPADKKRVQLIAHLTQGCMSGAVCLRFYRRDTGVIEVQTGPVSELPERACDDLHAAPYVTLVTTSLHQSRCPNFGRYSIISSLADRRTRRQQVEHDAGEGGPRASECVPADYTSLRVGCGASHDTFQFHSHCTTTEYTCHGSWTEGELGLMIASPKSRDSQYPGLYCFLYTRNTVNESRGAVEYLRLSAVARSCDRSVKPGAAGDKAYNLTLNGTCVESSQYNSEAVALSSTILLLALACSLALSTHVRAR